MTKRTTDANIIVPAPTVRVCRRSTDSAAPTRQPGGATGTTARLPVAGADPMTSPVPPAGRADARPVRRRTRTFRPNYLSFAGTYQCNLACPHCCVPIEWPERLDIAVAQQFLEDARAYGIEILGFTGGEPFLYPEFVISLCRRAAELGFRFDKIVTNG